MWLILGFAGMGLLIGNLVGLTSERVVTPVVGLLFAFIGTSILAVLHKLSSEDRSVAGRAILSLSGCCLLGVYLGVFVSEHALLTPKELRAHALAVRVAAPPNDNKYLRSGLISRANEIDVLKVQGAITPQQAYDQMYNLAREPAPPGGDR